jgi:REP element-mobilizing transposase RayT
MPQKRIPLDPGRMYHIWTHANGSENFFRSDENYRYFLEKYTYYIYPVVETFAYCLMPNHLHLMVRVRREKEVLDFLRDKKDNPTLQGFKTLGGFSKIISRQFSHLFNSYTQAYNKKYDRKGSLFIPNFQRKEITSNEYFTRLIVYIHNNPVHHGFVKEAGDWPHSSWHAYLFDKATKIKRDEGLSLFGTKKVFEKLHQNLVPENPISVFEG